MTCSMSKFLVLLCSLAISGGEAVAAPLSYKLPEETAELKIGPEPGYRAATNNCMACHSVDYINTQPPGKGRPFWDAEVRKMIKVYRAPIEDGDANNIIDYLSKTY